MHVNDFVKSYFEAWNQLDPEGIASHLAVNGVYRDMSEDVLQSRDELILSLRDFFRNDHQRYELIGDIQKSKNTIAFQYRMIYFKDGSGLDPDQSYQGAEFITMDGDEAVYIMDYYALSASGSPRKYARSGLSKEQLGLYKHKIAEMMNVQKLYLKPDLTLPELAGRVGCSVNHLSQVLNAGFGVSFFDYLNQYRVQHASELMRQHRDEKTPVLDIAFTVGFNSNSAFYAAFRKFLGQTPASFRRSLKKEAAK
jgi:AraC-like DNA-binding protein